ncbi:MAG: hypothetical protein K8F27_13250, partial [Sulfuricellaceae bacterium]|nr:hypothetical protein [Sulfuricellaceae bacterium]
MMKRTLLVSALAGALCVSTGFSLAADQEKTQKQEKVQIYGSQLMTPQERAEYSAKMRSAKTAEERDKIRKEHHESMVERAKARGVSLPDMPPARGGGMRPGAGMGPGGGGM